MEKRSVAVVGATGLAGQQFVSVLEGHPWFEMKTLVASKRSAGKDYIDALRQSNGAVGWWADGFPTEATQGMVVELSDDFDPESVDIIFTATEIEPTSEQAARGESKKSLTQKIEARFAAARPTISTTSAFRYEEDVPILIPGVNSDHAQLLKRQSARGWKGFVTPIPNCTTTGLAITLKPVFDAFGLNAVLMTSMQSMSGAGRTGGVLGLDIIDNVIPFISGEEEKVQKETQKILGVFGGEVIAPAEFKVSCTCTRVNVQDGHTEAVFVSTREACTVDDVKNAMRNLGTELEGLPSAPKEMIVLREDPFRPQPKRDRDTYGGMATVVGRVRQDTALANGIKYVLVSHNTKMGAAKGAALVAEQLMRGGLI